MTRLLSILLNFFLFLFIGCSSTNTSKVKIVDNSQETLIGGGKYTSYCFTAAYSDGPSHLVKGYGAGNKLAVAKQSAYQDLAERLKVYVEGEFYSRTVRDKAGQVSSEVDQKIRTRTSANLEQVERICVDQNDPGGQVHMAVQIDLRPSEKIIASKLVDHWGGVPTSVVWKGPRVLVKSPFIKRLNQSLPVATMASRREARVNLFRKYQQWHLDLDGLVIKLSQNELVDVLGWTQLNDQQFNMQLEDEFGNALGLQLRHEDEFRFTLDANNPQRYVSLFNVYGDGRVAVVRENIPFKQRMKIPESGIFSAGLIAPGTVTKDVYIALLTHKQVDTSQYRRLFKESQIGSDDDSYSLGQFITWLDQQPSARYAILRVTTSPR